jgi:hypothetical protein
LHPLPHAAAQASLFQWTRQSERRYLPRHRKNLFAGNKFTLLRLHGRTSGGGQAKMNCQTLCVFVHLRINKLNSVFSVLGNAQKCDILFGAGNIKEP